MLANIRSPKLRRSTVVTSYYESNYAPQNGSGCNCHLPSFLVEICSITAYHNPIFAN